MASLIARMTQQESLNFLLTNRIPRALLTRFMGWYSRIESPLLTRLSIAIWQRFATDLDLSESAEKEFDSLQACFIRRLKPGLRPIDPREDRVASPCDAIVGRCGRIENGMVFQAKGFPYEIADLIPDHHVASRYRDGIYVTLRLKSSMYHRFHAPVDCDIHGVTYISGDTWNVNPIALKRIEKLYCKNERAVLDLVLPDHNAHMTLVPVAAILVASMRFHCLDKTLDIRYTGPNQLACKASYQKGDELGYFQHGSTIILFASSGFRLADGITENTPIKMGEALLEKAQS